MHYVGAILALGLLVALHELGHLLFARAFGIGVRRFAIGFGPPIFTVRRRKIEWVLGAIPFGGYVVIEGMNPHEDVEPTELAHSFNSARPWKRAVVLAGGSFVNYLLGFLIMFALFVSGTHVPVPMTIGGVDAGSEAARAQLRPGDVIEAVNGERLSSWTSLVEKVNDGAGQELRFTVRREDQSLDIALKPRADEHGAGRIGVVQQYVFRKHGVGEGLIKAFAHVNTLAYDGLRMMGRLVTGHKGIGLASPVLIVKQASDAASFGWDSFLRVIVGISVALAVFNLLPVPALDGGRLLFVLVEAATGRPVNKKFETLLHTLGFVLLIALLFVVATGDVLTLWKPKPSATADSAQAADSGVQDLDAGVR